MRREGTQVEPDGLTADDEVNRGGGRYDSFSREVVKLECHFTGRRVSRELNEDEELSTPKR